MALSRFARASAALVRCVSVGLKGVFKVACCLVQGFVGSHFGFVLWVDFGSLDCRYKVCTSMLSNTVLILSAPGAKLCRSLESENVWLSEP